MENLVCEMCGANNRRIIDKDLNAYKCARCRTVLDYISRNENSDENKNDWMLRVSGNRISNIDITSKRTASEEFSKLIKYFDSSANSNYVFGNKLSLGTVKTFITNFPTKVESGLGYTVSQLDIRLRNENTRDIVFGMFDENANGKNGIVVTDDTLFINTDGKKLIIHFNEFQGAVTVENKSNRSRLHILANDKTYKVDVEKDYQGVKDFVKLINCAIDYHIAGEA